MVHTSFQKFIFNIKAETIKSAIAMIKASFKVQWACVHPKITFYGYVDDLKCQNTTMTVD